MPTFEQVTTQLASDIADKLRKLPANKQQSKTRVSQSKILQEKKASYFYHALTYPGAIDPNKTIKEWPKDLLHRTAIFINHKPIFSSDLAQQEILNKTIPNPALRNFILNHSHQDGYLYSLPTIMWSYFFNMKPSLHLIDRSSVFLFETQNNQITFKLITHHSSLRNMAKDGDEEKCNITFAHKGVLKLADNKVVIDNISFEYDPQSSLADELTLFENVYNTNQHFAKMRTNYGGKETAATFFLSRINDKLKAEFDNHKASKAIYIATQSAQPLTNQDAHAEIIKKIKDYQQLSQQARQYCKIANDPQPALAEAIHEQLAHNAKLMNQQLAQRLQELETAIDLKNNELQQARAIINQGIENLQLKYKLKNPKQLTKPEQWLINAKRSFSQNIALKIIKLFDWRLSTRAKAKNTIIQIDETTIELSMKLAQLHGEQQQLVNYQKELKLQYDIHDLLKSFKNTQTPHTQRLSSDQNTTYNLAFLKTVQKFQAQHGRLELDDLFAKIQNLGNHTLSQQQENQIKPYWCLDKYKQIQIINELELDLPGKLTAYNHDQENKFAPLPSTAQLYSA